MPSTLNNSVVRLCTQVRHLMMMHLSNCSTVVSRTLIADEMDGYLRTSLRLASKPS